MLKQKDLEQLENMKDTEKSNKNKYKARIKTNDCVNGKLEYIYCHLANSRNKKHTIQKSQNHKESYFSYWFENSNIIKANDYKILILKI